MVAAEQLGRACYGIEISPAYVAVALQRMADMGEGAQTVHYRSRIIGMAGHLRIDVQGVFVTVQAV